MVARKDMSDRAVEAVKEQTKAVAEAHVQDGEVEPVRMTALPRPVEPADAGSKTPRKTPPVYPDDYDTSTQPHAPEMPTVPVKE